MSSSLLALVGHPLFPIFIHGSVQKVSYHLQIEVVAPPEVPGFVTLALFEGRKEEQTIFSQRTAEGRTVLSAGERRLVDRREWVTRLETLVSEKAENIPPEFIASSFSDDVDHAARGASKLGRE